jgi:hypothetical protein
LASFALAVQSLRAAPPTANADAVAALPSDGPGPAEPTEGQPAAAQTTGETEPEAPRQAPSLRRELRAIATLYAACCLLPWLVGTMFAE